MLLPPSFHIALNLVTIIVADMAGYSKLEPQFVFSKYNYILQVQGCSLQGNIYSSVGEVMLQCKIMLQAIFGVICFYVGQ